MNKLLPAIFLTAALSLSMPSTAGTETDSNVPTTGLWYTEELYLHNLTGGSANPAHVRNLPISKLNDIRITYDLQNGAFMPVDGAKHSRFVDADIYGIKKLERIFFEGSLKYSNQDLTDMRWNGTVLTSELNPFLLADTLRYDSLTNDADREQFILKGSVAYSLNQRITLGLCAAYNVASKADQSDPRLKANAARTLFSPGINYKTGNNFSAGLSGFVEIFHEDVKSSVMDNMLGEHNIVHIFKALGVFEAQDAIGYKRRYDGIKYGASLQSSYEGKRIGNFTQISYEMNSEDAEDGETSYQYKGGDFRQKSLNLSSRFLISSPGIMHNITLKAGMDNTSGTWYTQKQIHDEWNMMNYTVVSKDVIHKQKNLNASLSYRIDFMKNGLSDFTASVDAAYSKTDIFQYPDENQVHYSMLKTEMSLVKHFNKGRIKYEALAFGGLYKALDELDITVSTPKPAQKRMYNGYYLPKFSYLSSDCINAGIGVSVCCPVSMNASKKLLRLSARASYRKSQGNSDIYKEADRTDVTAAVGFTF